MIKTLNDGARLLADVRLAAGPGLFIHSAVDGLVPPPGYEDQAIATNLNDVLNGSALDDIIYAGQGHDILAPGAGDDRVDGGGGYDAVDYGADTLGVSVDLAKGVAKGAFIGKDTLIGVEGAQGGSGDDVLIGMALRDADLFGGAGRDRIQGGEHNDQLTGGEGDDRIMGGDGHDVIYGNSGSNVVDAGDGVDWVLDEGGASDLRGGGKDDHIIAGGGDDLVDGGEGNDLVVAGSGNDRVDGGLGDDELNGGVGDDSLKGGVGRDTIHGEAGDDHLRGQADSDKLSGGDGNDWLFGGEAADRLTGGRGKDVFAFQNAVDSLVAASDTIEDFDAKDDRIAVNFKVKALAQSQTVRSLSELETVLNATALPKANAVVVSQKVGSGPALTWLAIDTNGKAGFQADGDLLIQLTSPAHMGDLSLENFIKTKDEVQPGPSISAPDIQPGANGVLVGTEGADDLYGGDDDDEIQGGGGNDTIFGQLGDNHLLGGDGDDTIIDERGAAFIDAGDGDDLVFAGYGDDLVYGGEGDDHLDASLGDDTVYGGGGDDHIRTWNGEDFLSGGDGDDSLHAGEQDDILVGGAGDDDLLAYLQDDILYGGAGSDKLSVGDHKPGGRLDHDVIVFRDAAESSDLGWDRLTGYFDANLDSVNLWFEVEAIDAPVSAPSLDELVSALDAAALGAHHAALVSVVAGDRHFLAIDANGIAGFQSGEDLLIEYDATCDMSQLSLSTFIQQVYDWE